jgi:hypothetical protein
LNVDGSGGIGKSGPFEQMRKKRSGGFVSVVEDVARAPPVTVVADELPDDAVGKPA